MRWLNRLDAWLRRLPRPGRSDAQAAIDAYLRHVRDLEARRNNVDS